MSLGSEVFFLLFSVSRSSNPLYVDAMIGWPLIISAVEYWVTSRAEIFGSSRVRLAGSTLR